MTYLPWDVGLGAFDRAKRCTACATGESLPSNLAEDLFISERTVKARLSAIFRKPGCRSPMEVTAPARRAF